MKSLMFVSFAFLLLASACSSTGPQVKQQAFAEYRSSRVYENEFPIVWKAIEESLRNFKVTERDPKEVDEVEMKRILKRTLETDWVYSQSRDKYVEYSVNNTPRKRYLQIRVRFQLLAQRYMGGTEVKVRALEEIEKVDELGNSKGYDSVENVDTSRINDLLEKIQLSILSSPSGGTSTQM